MDSSKNKPSFSPSQSEYVPKFPKLLSNNQVNNRQISILVEGNIGAGKSTFLNYLLKYKDIVEVIPEPVDKFRNFNGVNLLVRNYSLICLNKLQFY